MKDISNYLKHHGFFSPSADIYHGLAKSWDCGPNGTELKRKLKNLWWKFFVSSHPYNVGFDSSIFTLPKVLEASGHLKNFHDWLVECSSCQKRYRLDNLLNFKDFSSFLEQKNKDKLVIEKSCPNCKKKLTSPRQFNLLLSSSLQITRSENINKKENIVYLRPETCQGIFINFLAIQRSIHRHLPFGVGQIGKSFRNEITLHHGVFRTREFEQMELEFFCTEEGSKQWWDYWNEKAWKFFINLLNDQNKAQKKELMKKELPHYARQTTDLYFQYQFGSGEICSISDRGNYDLKQHSEYSQQFLGIKKNDQEIFPNVIEVSFGVERLMLALLEDAYQEEVVENSQLTRTVLKLSPLLAPYFVAIIPLSKQLREKAKQIYLSLLPRALFAVSYEETGNIGNNYRRQDAIGTYYCLTIDFQTLEDESITIRQRDGMKQKRIITDNLAEYLNQKYQNNYSEFFEK